MTKIKVMIADDHLYLRNSLETDFSSYTEIEFLGAAENGKELLKMIEVSVPDIILLDINMPVMDGWEVLEVLKEKYPNVRAIIYSMENSDFYIANAMFRGAAGFLAKNQVDKEYILQLIKHIYEKGFYFDQEVAKYVLEIVNSDSKIYYPIADQHFTEREIEVMKQICMGKPLKQIASDLKIAYTTVKRHKENISDKTQTNNLRDLMLYAIREGIFIVPKKK